jgi:hypothetical protein
MGISTKKWAEMDKKRTKKWAKTDQISEKIGKNGQKWAKMDKNGQNQ